MGINSFIQLISAFTGLLASIYFAIGVVTQNTKMMLNMSQAYYGPNKSTVESLSQQKADYTIGVLGLIIAFFLQAISFLLKPQIQIPITPKWALISLSIIFFILFYFLRKLSQLMSKCYECQINELFNLTL